jgi:thioredoxin-related protein
MNYIKTLFIFCFILNKTIAQNSNITSFYEGPFEDVLKESKRINRPIFLDFTSNRCKHCIKMEKETFQNSTIANDLNSNFIAYKVDLDDIEGQSMIKKYKIEEFPSYLIIDPKNNELGTIKGFYLAGQFKKALDKIMRDPSQKKATKKKKKFFGLFS